MVKTEKKNSKYNIECNTKKGVRRYKKNYEIGKLSKPA